MGKLHEILAAESTVAKAWDALKEDTAGKFKADKISQYFIGFVKSLKMNEESLANQAIQDAAKTEKMLATNVLDTLDFALDRYAALEDIQVQKNMTNARATADVEVDGTKVLVNMPIDQLLGLESRLGTIRSLITAMPTLDASVNWTWDEQKGCWVSPASNTTKTERQITWFTASPATDKHPAQLKESTKDEVVGLFTEVKYSGCVTAVQKAEAILKIDKLIVAIKQARQRANDTDVVDAKIGKTLKDFILAPLKVR